MEKDLNVEPAKNGTAAPFISITNHFMEQIEGSLRSGEKIEFVSFTAWQKKHNLNIKANHSEYRPLDH
ncbi:MAG: hypothetical protein WC527_00575 [Candidatus Margulisiibacteriota bacterium]